MLTQMGWVCGTNSVRKTCKIILCSSWASMKGETCVRASSIFAIEFSKVPIN